MPQLGTKVSTTWSPTCDVADARADLLDHPGGLVPERHGQRPHPRPVHHRDVGVADAGGLDADEQLAGARRAQLDLLELHGLRLPVGTLVGDGAEHGGDGLHGSLPFAAVRRRPGSPGRGRCV